MLRKLVSFAEKLLSRADIKRCKPVVSHAGENYSVSTKKVKSVKQVDVADVYNMEVDQYHNFVIEGGMVVHNCADQLRYSLISYHANFSRDPIPEKPLLARMKEKVMRKNHRRRRYS